MYQYPFYQPNPNAEYYAQKAREIAGYGYQPPIQPPINNPPQQPGFICRAVTSIDEAKAAMIDAFNSFVFADLANGKIYVKRIDNSGISSLQTYALETAVEKPSDYAGQIAALEKRIGELEGKKPEAA